MLKSERITDHESRTPKKRNGQTNPTLRKLNAPKENGLVLPQSEDGGSKRSAVNGQPSTVSGGRSVARRRVYRHWRVRRRWTSGTPPRRVVITGNIGR